jgi:hypothetical protein
MRKPPQMYLVKGILNGEPFERSVCQVSGRYAIKEVRRKYPEMSLMTAVPVKAQ